MTTVESILVDMCETTADNFCLAINIAERWETGGATCRIDLAGWVWYNVPSKTMYFKYLHRNGEVHIMGVHVESCALDDDDGDGFDIEAFDQEI